MMDWAGTIKQRIRARDIADNSFRALPKDEPSKADLQSMLREAAQNTAAQQTREPRDGTA
jgi:hypothetical protein